jgi:hypothetical protein
MSKYGDPIDLNTPAVRVDWQDTPLPELDEEDVYGLPELLAPAIALIKESGCTMAEDHLYSILRNVWWNGKED